MASELPTRSIILGVIALIIVVIVLLNAPTITKLVKVMVGYNPIGNITFEIPKKDNTEKEAYAKVQESILKNYLTFLVQCKAVTGDPCFCEKGPLILPSDTIIKITGDKAEIFNGEIDRRNLELDKEIPFSELESQIKLYNYGQSIQYPAIKFFMIDELKSPETAKVQDLEKLGTPNFEEVATIYITHSQTQASSDIIGITKGSRYYSATFGLDPLIVKTLGEMADFHFYRFSENSIAIVRKSTFDHALSDGIKFCTLPNIKLEETPKEGEQKQEAVSLGEQVENLRARN